MKAGRVVAGVSVLWVACAQAFDPVVQSDRQIPRVRDADVVVVGGSSAAVAAALAAKTNGASVFLVAPRTYLGEDVAGTRELWPAPVSEFYSNALAQQIFTLRTPYTYTASLTPNATHPDPSNSRLTDGVQDDAVSGSVQYDASVSITSTFAGTGTVSSLDLYYYYRPTSTPFDTLVSGVETSLDGLSWTAAPFSTAVETLSLASGIETRVAHVTLTGGAPALRVRLKADLGPGAVRQLLDELVFFSDEADPLPGSSFSATPLRVKQGLEQALQNAGIPYLMGSPVCDVLKDDQGRPAGVVLANRKGRQAVTARAVIDATDDAWPAQQAGAAKTAFTPGTYAFSRIVMADATNAPAAAGLSVSELPGISYAVSVTGVNAPAGMPGSISGRVYRCTFTTSLVSGSALERLDVEQQARDLTWVKTCFDQADCLTWMPPDPIVGAASEPAAVWAGADALDLNAFRPAGVPHLFVLSLRADVTRQLAAEMRNPARMMTLGERIGAAAAAEALARAPLSGVSLPAEAGLTLGSEAVCELLGGLPPVNTNAAGTVAEGLRALPVLATCEVLVVGAGTAGAPAAIAAGRAGADTVAVEFLYTLGGVQTDGRIGVYYHGNNCGFTQNDVDPGVNATGSVLATSKAEWYRSACRSAGVRVLYGTMAVGALTQTNALKGVVVVLPDGTRGIIRANAVVDATGSADIAAAAGEETQFINASEPAVQGAQLAPHKLGDSYTNIDVTFVDPSDVADVSFMTRRAHASLNVWDAGQSPASRERRRLVGVVTVTPVDVLNGRTWPDTLARPRSNFDSHGFTVHDLYFIVNPGTADVTANLPYRALLPKTLDGLLVAGIGLSAHRDAMPYLRMQRDMQNVGYAAGYAAALSVQTSVAPRNVSVAALQAHLVAKGIIGAADAGASDSFPLSAAAIQSAVTGLTNGYATLATVLADTETARPMLRDAYAAQADPAHRLMYAHVLGMLNDATGVEALAAAVEAGAWDAGWNFGGGGQYGFSVSLMDSYIIALGRTRDPRGVAPVLAKVAQLNGNSAFSHIRACCHALEALDGGSGIPALTALLGQVSGFAFTNSLVAPVIEGYSATVGNTERNNGLKELAVARALYRLGDSAGGDGARTLSDYARDPREVYANHARQVLSLGPQSETSDGEWTGTALAADWLNAANWRDGIRAGGIGAVARITNAVAAAQTLSLQGSLVTVGSLAFGGADRTVADGVLDISGAAASVDVAAGTQVTLSADVLSGGTLDKRGAGDLTFAGTATLGGLDIAAGDVAFSDPDARFFQAYAADPAAANTSPGSTVALALRTDFRVNSAVTVTELGAYDSGGDGFEAFKKVSIYPQAGGAPLASLAFPVGETFALVNGYRFRRLPEPLRLPPGNYAVVTFGYYGSDAFITAAEAGRAGALSDGGGALTFLTNAFSTASGALAFPAAAVGPATDYAVSAGSFRFATGTAVKSVSGPLTLPAGSTLDAAALDAQLSGGLRPGAGGIGTVTNATAAFPVTLRLGVAAGATNTLAASTVGDRADGPLALVKEGAGLLALQGPLAFRGGLRVDEGAIQLDSPASLGDGDLSFGTGGVLRFLSGGTLDRMLYADNQADANNRSTRLALPPGGTLTLTRGIEVPRAYEYGGFAIQPFDNGAGTTRAHLDGARVGYLDLYLLGDGPSGAGGAEHVWTDVTGTIRKLACGYETIAGSRFTFGQGCDFAANWFDVANSNAYISVTNGAQIRVTGQLRFIDGFASQLSLDGGRLSAALFGALNTPTYAPILFNGTELQALGSSDTFFCLATNSAAPLIRDGGAVFDTQTYSVGIQGRGFAQAPESAGAFVKLGAGTLKVAAPMSYTGPTLVSNGTLRLDFALWRGTNSAVNLLATSADVRLSAGAAFEVLGTTNAFGASLHTQTLARVAADGAGATVRVELAELGTSALEGALVKSGGGTLALRCDASGAATFGGALHVQAGTFVVRGLRASPTVVIPYAGFESNPLLPAFTNSPSNIGSLDKRGTAATGCPGWTFSATSGNNQAGYQRNGSYFSGTAASTAPEGSQTAFVRQNGALQTTLAIPADGTYTLSFKHCSRYYSSAWFTNEVIRTRLDGGVLDTLVVTNRTFLTQAVSLGHLAAGSHTLQFQGSNEAWPSGDPCALIDDVRIAGTADVGGASGVSNPEAALLIQTGARVELDYAGSFKVGDLVIGGVHYRGGSYGAATHPDVFTGTGLIQSQSGGTHLMVK